MLQALDALTGLVTAADEARREARYVCPECGKVVGLRSGAQKIAYFAHYARTLCTLAKPESPRHRALKLLCQKLFAPLPVVWEVPVGARRVDALVGGLFVVECQASPLGIHEWQARTENHNRAGFPVLWLWDVKRLCRRNTLAEAIVLERNQRAVWAAPEVRLCHAESRDLLFVGDKHGILPCRLASLSPAERTAARHAWPDTFFRSQALHKLAFSSGFDKDARFHFASRTRGLRLVRFGEGKD